VFAASALVAPYLAVLERVLRRLGDAPSVRQAALRGDLGPLMDELTLVAPIVPAEEAVPASAADQRAQGPVTPAVDAMDSMAAPDAAAAAVRPAPQSPVGAADPVAVDAPSEPQSASEVVVASHPVSDPVQPSPEMHTAGALPAADTAQPAASADEFPAAAVWVLAEPALPGGLALTHDPAPAAADAPMPDAATALPVPPPSPSVVDVAPAVERVAAAQTAARAAAAAVVDWMLAAGDPCEQPDTALAEPGDGVVSVVSVAPAVEEERAVDAMDDPML
jgi:hypothetical protein